MCPSVVMMGVAGCGKSTLGAAVARATGLPLVEGDDFHSAASRTKMSEGVALTDTDRAGWLQRLCEELRRHPDGVILTCSALKRAYRETLAAASPGLKFVFLDISLAGAKARVEARAATHFFSASLIDSQFATLESPAGEPRVLDVDAAAPISLLTDQVVAWLRPEVSA
jgi:gluconokinase